jgi:AraC-like DNA-binding protein
MELAVRPSRASNPTIVRMIRYDYVLNDFRHWIGGFSKLLQVPVTGGTCNILPDYGKGSIRTGHLPTGISYMVMDLSLRDDLVLARRGYSPSGLCLQFDLKTDHNTLRLSSTGAESESIYPRESRLRQVAILFPHSFLRRYLRKDILSDLMGCAEEAPETHRESIPFEYRQLLEDILHAEPKSPLHYLLLHNRLLLLAEKFLHTFISKTLPLQPNSISWAKGRQKDIEALKSVMRVLSDSQLNKFPSIEALSRTAMMSSTKLKTRFKQIYGMKLYEFYNRNRLVQAKEMLRTGRFSVKQVGVNIGFSNLSNFAKAFKKEFGVLPKEILKSK